MFYCPTCSDDVDCIVGNYVAVVAGAAVVLYTLLHAAIFHIRFDVVVAQNIDVPSNVDGFDSAAALVRAELAANIVALGVDCMWTATMMMTVSLQTTFDDENSIEPSEMKWNKMKIRKYSATKNIIQIIYVKRNRTTNDSYFPCQMSWNLRK